jgi:uncharacterized membrane protein
VDFLEAGEAVVAEEPEEAGDMRARDFLNQLRHDDIVAAIRDAERQTSGEIRVFISRKPVDEPVSTAQAAFVRLGMEKTRGRNGVLIFVAPRAQKFAVIGDTAVHAKCGEAFWLEMRDSMTEHFRKGEFTHGIILGIKKAGVLLSQHFPRQRDDRNELPDDIVHD